MPIRSGETVTDVVARSTGMIVVRLAAVSTLIFDHLASLWSLLARLRPGKKTGHRQMEPGYGASRWRSAAPAGPHTGGDPPQDQERASVYTARADPWRRGGDRLPERHPQHPGHADQPDSVYQGGWGAKQHLLQLHPEAAAFGILELSFHRHAPVV